MGEYKNISILFLDIRNFTKFFDQIYTRDPEQVARLLGDIWGILSRIVDDYSGEIHKTIGDGIMVLFNNSINAYESAFNIMFKIARIDEHLNIPTPADPAGWLGLPFQAGIGIEEGTVGVEDVDIQGKENKLVIGMPVIIAARLANEAKPMRILIGEEAYNQIQERYRSDIFIEKVVTAKHQQRIKCWEIDISKYLEDFRGEKNDNARRYICF